MLFISTWYKNLICYIILASDDWFNTSHLGRSIHRILPVHREKKNRLLDDEHNIALFRTAASNLRILLRIRHIHTVKRKKSREKEQHKSKSMLVRCLGTFWHLEDLLYETTDNIYATKSIWQSTPATLLHGKNIILCVCVFLVSCPNNILRYIIPSLKFSLTLG